MDLAEMRRRQEAYRQEVKEIRESVVERCKEGVRENDICRPVVVALTQGGGQLEHFFPTWESDKEKQEVFAHLNRTLLKADVTASVCAVHGRWVEEADLDAAEVRQHEEVVPAIIVTTHRMDGKVMHIHPYKHTDDGIDWHEPVEETSFETQLITVPEGN